jgi:hypothetical protein
MDKSLMLFVLALYILVVPILLFLYRLKFLKRKFGIEKALLFLLILTGITFMLTSASYSIYKADHGRYKGTIVSTTDSVYISSDSSYYIGKTQNFIFIHDVKDKSTMSIPADRVNYLRIKLDKGKNLSDY